MARKQATFPASIYSHTANPFILQHLIAAGWSGEATASLEDVRWSMAAMAALLMAASGRAADLKPETLKAWDQYIEEKTSQAKSLAHAPLVGANDDRDLWTELRSGEILVAPAGPKQPRRVPSGLIHDWMGTAFIPSATVLEVLAVVRDYDRYKDVYRPGVIDSQACVATKDEDCFSLALMNRSFFTKKAFKGDYRARYFRLDDNR
jgi:hypothetical protein